MPRVTATEVKEILDTSLTDAAVSTWIDIASDQVDDIAAFNGDISTTRLGNIELMLSAHYATTQDPRHESASSSSRNVSYEGETGMNLMASKYGQNAVQLDPTGLLRDSQKQKATLSVPDSRNLDQRNG